MQSPPAGWPRISPSVFYDDAVAAIDWLCRAFGFEVRLKVEGGDGGIVHSELVFGGGVVMVASAGRMEGCKSPRSVGGANTQALFAYVDDVESHCARARAAGASIVREPETKDYGSDWWTDRGYEARDLEGHRWWFSERLRSARP